MSSGNLHKTLLRINIHIILRNENSSPENDLDSLTDLYRKHQRYISNNHRGKRFKAKLIANQQGLFIDSGSWWSDNQEESGISYKQITQCAICFKKPHKIILLISSKDGKKTEYVLIRTKKGNQAGKLFGILSEMKKKFSEENVLPIRPQTKQVMYNANADISKIENHLGNFAKIKSNDDLLGHNLKNKVNRHNTFYYRDVPISELDDVFEEFSSPVSNACNCIKESKLDAVSYVIEREDLSKRKCFPVLIEEYSGQSKKLARLNLHPLSSSNIVNKSTYPPMSRQVKNSVLYAKPRRSNPDWYRKCEVTNSVAIEPIDFGDTDPVWEVNICYIKNDPVLGCVEDENGPVYMYAAHQLVPTMIKGQMPDDSSSNLGNACHGSEGDDSSSSHDEVELERFIMEARENKLNRKQLTYYRL